MKIAPFIIGLTGNIATGKSSVLKILQEHGAEVIDADVVGHELMASSQSLRKTIVDHFGEGVLSADGKVIDRKQLGALVFQDGTKLVMLESLMYPDILKAIRKRVHDSPASLIVIEAIKLIESGLAGICDQVWVVTASPETQLKRLMSDRGLTEAEARLRIEAQSPQIEKMEKADVIIRNDGTRAQLKRQVAKALEEIRRD